MDEVDASRGRGSETGARLPKLHSAPAPRAGGNGSCLPRGRGGSGLNMIVAQTSAAVFVMSIAGGASIRERRCRQMRACETVPMQTSDSWILVVGPKQETVKFNAWPCGVCTSHNRPSRVVEAPELLGHAAGSGRGPSPAAGHVSTLRAHGSSRWGPPYAFGFAGSAVAAARRGRSRPRRGPTPHTPPPL